MKSLVTCLACLGLAACFAAPEVSSPTVTASIGPEGGRLSSADGKLTLRIPAGALTTTETITVSPSSNSPLPAQAVALGHAYSIGPASLNLEAPAEVSVAVSSSAHGDGEALGVFEAGDGEVALVALPTELHPDGTISASISVPGDVQAARYVLLDPTTGGSGATSGTTGGAGAGSSSGTIGTSAAGSSSATTSGGNTSGATISGSSSGATTGGGTSTGSTGQTAYCGGAAGTTGGGGQLQGCQLINQYCSGGQDEVDCTHGNCTCLRQGQAFAWVQEATNDCSQAWSDCGLPPGSVPGGIGGTTGASGPVGGAATVQGAIAFSGQANGFTEPSGTSPYALEVTLAQDGLCGGYEATGHSVFIGLTSDAPIAPGNYPVGGTRPLAGTAIIAVSDWDDAAGDHGVLGYATDGTFTVDAISGSSVSGSFDANVDLGGGPQALSGSFSAVPACAP